MKKVLNFILMAVCTIFGIVDASAFTADAVAAATAGATAINGSGMANATTGSQATGVHTNPLVNNGLVTDVTRLGSPDLIDDPVDREIVKMFHSAFPVDQICRHLPQGEQKGMRYAFYSVDERPIKDTVKTALTSTTGSATLVVNNPDMFSVSDTILVPSVLEHGSTKQPLRLYVSAVNTNDITVQPIYVQTTSAAMTIPAIKENTAIYRLGRAAAEGEVQTEVWSTLPEKDELFMQIFKTQISESTIMAMSEKEADWTFNDQEELALRDMRKCIELSYIYGTKGYFVDTKKKKYVYTCAGIIQQILERGTLISYTEAITKEADLITDVVKPIFTGNSGSASRYLFGGSDFVSMIATIEGIQKQMDATQVFRKFGVDWKAIQFMSWQLNLVQHPLLDEVGLSKCAFVLDLPYVKKQTALRLSKDALELKKAGIFDGQSTVWTEISSIALKYAKTHAFIYATDQFNPA
jgi:hypothetical protein